MARRTGLIVAWDSNTFNNQDQDLVGELLPEIDFIKLGLQAYTALDEHGVSVAWKVEQFCKRKAMRDWKLLDIANTVTSAFKNILLMGTGMVTIHAQMSDEGLKSVADLSKGTDVLPLAVTVLTDLDDKQCTSRFLPDVKVPAPDTAKRLVVQFAQVAYKAGIRGFVCSAQEARIIRRTLNDPTVRIVTPAIRPHWSVEEHEQKRVTTPAEASMAGADYLVVGRPILKPIRMGMTPLDAARMIRQEADNAPATV